VITILAWLWSQPGVRTPFIADHVNVWAGMVRRHCSLDIDIACVTDTPEGIDPDIRIIAPPHEFEDITLPNWPGFRPQCLRRISMFRRDAADIFGAERILCMDLDCVIAGSIDHIVGAKEDVRICLGTAMHRPYNGSLMLLTAGARPHVYEALDQAAAREASAKCIGSDQAWLAHIMPGEATFGLDDGVMMSNGFRMKDGAVCFYPGDTKPWHEVARGKDRWVMEHYRAGPRGRAIYLGYGPDVWADAEAALDEPWHAVFASPEAAQHWPGPVNAIAHDDRHAERLARMLGYDLTMCGAQKALEAA
jgi:hypothetical protein